MLNQLIEVLQQIGEREKIAVIEQELSKTAHQLVIQFTNDGDFEKVAALAAVLKSKPAAISAPKQEVKPIPILTRSHCELAILESLANHVQLKRSEIFIRCKDFFRKNYLMGAAEEKRHMVYHRRSNTRTEGRFVWEEMCDKAVGRLLASASLRYIVLGSEKLPERNRYIEITDEGVEQLKSLRQQLKMEKVASSNGSKPLLDIDWSAVGANS